MKLRDGCAISALRGLIPEAKVAGGTFEHTLPSADQLTPHEARETLDKKRPKATNLAVQSLLREIEVAQSAPLSRNSDGSRIWPEGFIGSVTKDGTVVLAALINKNKYSILGIDVEFYEKDTDDLLSVKNQEFPPGIADHLRDISVFSTKESVYKAVNPVIDRKLDFGDITLKWFEVNQGANIGTARCHDSIEIDVKCTSTGKWIVSAAHSFDNSFCL